MLLPRLSTVNITLFFLPQPRPRTPQHTTLAHLVQRSGSFHIFLNTSTAQLILLHQVGFPRFHHRCPPVGSNRPAANVKLGRKIISRYTLHWFIRDCLGAASELRSVRVERCWRLDAIDHGFNNAEYSLVSHSDSRR